jgi:ATP-dependent DNA ligase
MSKYLDYKYIYPPRPSNAIPYSDLDSWDNGSLIGQPKLNGSNCLIFTDGEKFIIMNRHKQRLTNFKIDLDELKSIYRGKGWMIINCEYLNKNKKDETGKSFNHKLVIFDILAIDNEHLVGETFEQRIDLLDDLYGTHDSEKEYLYGISENIYRVKSYRSGFKEIFDKLTIIDMIEGLVMKRLSAPLEYGATENNNTRSQIKCRKMTKNYKF